MIPRLKGPALALTFCALLLACEPTHQGDDENVSDGSGSTGAVASLSDATNSENTSSGYAWYRLPEPTLVAQALQWLKPERTALAAGYSCGTNVPTYTGTNPYYFTPATPCTVTFASGATATVTWSGSWTLTFSMLCTPGYGLLTVAQPVNCTLSRSTSNIQKVVTLPPHTYTTTWDTSANSGYSTPIHGPITAVCGPTTACPTGTNVAGGQRTITINGTHIKGLVDGVTVWDHTVSTPSPFVVTGSGQYRTVAAGGSIMVQHNLARYTSTTTITSPLTYSSGCDAFPTGGSLRTTFSGTKYDSLAETLTFSSTCGDATLVTTNGISKAVQLTR